jgi:hypothetical protein
VGGWGVEKNIQFLVELRIRFSTNVSAHSLVAWDAFCNWTGHISISYLPALVVQALERNGGPASIKLHLYIQEINK